MGVCTVKRGFYFLCGVVGWEERTRVTGLGYVIE
jgi:hypothetical protein